MKTIYSTNHGFSTNDPIQRLSWSGQVISGFRLTVSTDSQRDKCAYGLEGAVLIESDRDLIPDSKFLENHLLIEPVAALLEREETGYRALRKAVVSVTLVIRKC